LRCSKPTAGSAASTSSERRKDPSGFRAKLRRAEEHREAFDELFGDYLARAPYSITVDYDEQTGWHSLRWHVDQEPPLEDLALIFGDILGNLRTSLDYLVWQLVLAGGGTPSRTTAFPVARSRRFWREQSEEMLQGVAPEWVAKIKSVQPYHVKDRPELHPLAILDHVNNLNKHRFLPVAVLTPERFSYLVNVADVAENEVFESRDLVERPIVHGGELARVRCESRRPLEFKVAESPRFRISFKDGLGHDWQAFELVQWVRETVAEFEPAFL